MLQTQTRSHFGVITLEVPRQARALGRHWIGWMAENIDLTPLTVDNIPVEVSTVRRRKL